MSDTPFTYFLDPHNLGLDDDEIEFDREAMHGKPVSPAIAAVILLRQINSRLRDLQISINDPDA